MKEEYNISKQLLWISYIYLALPVVIFALGWCRWYIGVPIAIVCCASIWLSIRSRKCKAGAFEGSVVKVTEGKTFVRRKLSAIEIGKLVVIVVLILGWVGLSGIGGFSFQNADHKWRNAIFEMLLSEKWPVIYEERGLVYYLGFWLPAAFIGKVFGAFVGNIFLLLWTVLGISCIYALICTKSKKIVIWPLLVFIFFSGMDIVGSLLLTDEPITLLGSSHLEWWAEYFQYSSNTTQLYWVFNQAVPMWLATLLMVMDERPQNLIFLCSLTMLTSTLPFIGMLPYVLYYMYKRCEWKEYQTILNGWKQVFRNWVSFQNLVGGGCIGILSFFYLMGNVNFHKLFLKLQALLGDSKLVEVFMPWLFVCAGVLGICVLGSLILLGARNGFGKERFKKLYKNLIKTLQVVAITLIIVVLVFLSTDAQLFRKVMNYVLSLLLFLVLEMGVIVFCLYQNIKESFLLKMTAYLLCIIPFIKVGNSIDFCMRASIPALFIMMLWCIEVLKERKRDWSVIVLIGCLMLGAITPMHELSRSIQGTMQRVSIERKTYSTIIQGDNFSGTLDNYFWKYIANP